MKKKYITYANDKKIHIQSPFFAGLSLCGKDAMMWHNSRLKATCEGCIEEQKHRPYPGELQPAAERGGGSYLPVTPVEKG